MSACSSLQLFWQDGAIPAHFRTGVSLHSHTMFSEEGLGMVARYAAEAPFLGAAVGLKKGRWPEQCVDFENVFWTPPLSPRQAYRLEEKQVQRKLQLPALVSLTDHDDLRAPNSLRVLERFSQTPISTEWTIPFGGTFFHLGVHNLPAAQADAIFGQLRQFTLEPVESKLPELLEMLNSLPDLLLVLNHPLWDEKGIGPQNHRATLDRLLFGYGRFFHAVELNGLRPWSENRQVVSMARELDIPIVSGGDRHGREANATLNLSRAGDFRGFVHELRYERVSHVVFMPQYKEPLSFRIIQTIVDVLREYPENFQGRKLWSDRVFYRDPATGSAEPVNRIWANGGPFAVQCFVAGIHALEWRGLRSALWFALNARNSNAWTD